MPTPEQIAGYTLDVTVAELRILGSPLDMVAADHIERLRDALQVAEAADQKAINCEEHEPSDAPETCEHCFPLADDARLKRWAALGIHQAKD